MVEVFLELKRNDLATSRAQSGSTSSNLQLVFALLIYCVLLKESLSAAHRRRRQQS